MLDTPRFKSGQGVTTCRWRMESHGQNLVVGWVSTPTPPLPLGVARSWGCAEKEGEPEISSVHFFQSYSVGGLPDWSKEFSRWSSTGNGSRGRALSMRVPWCSSGRWLQQPGRGWVNAGGKRGKQLGSEALTMMGTVIGGEAAGLGMETETQENPNTSKLHGDRMSTCDKVQYCSRVSRSWNDDVSIVKNQLKNVGFHTCVRLYSRKVRAGLDVPPQESGPPRWCHHGREAWWLRANRNMTMMETKNFPARRWKADRGTAKLRKEAG